jgi:hypothetical protein
LSNFAVGAKGESSNIGAVYLYSFTSQSETNFEYLLKSRVSPSGLSSGALFGSSVSLYEGSEVSIGNPSATVAIGAPGDSSNVGSVYIYYAPDALNPVWSSQSTLVPTDAVTAFGQSVSLYTDTVVVGAVSSTSGVAYVYVRDSTTKAWTQQTKLVPSVASAGDGFASSLSLYRELISGNNALILAAGSPAVSAAYVIFFDPRTSTWSENARLSGVSGDQFGYSVSAYESIVAVGSPSASGSLGRVNTYRAFNNSKQVGWSSQSELLPSSITSGAKFGTSVSQYGEYLVAGAPVQDTVDCLDNGAYCV